MIRILLATICSLSLARGEVNALADLVPDLGSEKFEVRKSAMKKLEVYAKSNPEKTLKEVVPILKRDLDPETRLRIREVARNLMITTTKSQFGFYFSPNLNLQFNEVPCIGIQIIAVRLDTPAERCGLKFNDIILAVNDTPFPRTLSEDQIREVFATQAPGKETKLTIRRQGKELELFASPMKVPLEEEAIREARAKFDAWLEKELAKEELSKPEKVTPAPLEIDPFEAE